MKNTAIGLLFICVSGCASCHQQSAAPAGIPMAGVTAAPAATTSSEATPAVGIGWETVSFSFPKPKLFAVPKPQQGPQVVGIPILAGAPTMAMGQPAMMAQPTMVAQPQYVQSPANVAPQSNPAPQSSSQPCDSCTPAGCQPGCAEEGCQTQTQVMQECDALMGEIAELQRQISVRAGDKASVEIVQ